jgi:hypothetical protein
LPFKYAFPEGLVPRKLRKAIYFGFAIYRTIASQKKRKRFETLNLNHLAKRVSEHGKNQVKSTSQTLLPF